MNIWKLINESWMNEYSMMDEQILNEWTHTERMNEYWMNGIILNKWIMSKLTCLSASV